MKISTAKFGLILALVCLWTLAPRAGVAEVIAVEPVLAGKAFASERTKTFLWAAKDAKATLVFIPGGNGRLGLDDDRKDLGGFYGNTLKPLSQPGVTSGVMNVVVFDSPTALDEGRIYPTSRTTADHLMRIESVVVYYKEKLNKPVWLMGHSNGAASVTEFYKYLQKDSREQLIAGMIYSSGRNGTDFNSKTTNLPVLFLAHRKDGCAGSSNIASMLVFRHLKEIDAAKVDYVFIEGGSAEGEPCHSGYHMFNGASAEAYNAIDAFVGPFYR